MNFAEKQKSQTLQEKRSLLGQGACRIARWSRGMALVSVKIPSVLDATCRNHRVGVKKGTVKDAKSLGENGRLFGATKRGAGNGSIFAAMVMMMMMMMMVVAWWWRWCHGFDLRWTLLHILYQGLLYHWPIVAKEYDLYNCSSLEEFEMRFSERGLELPVPEGWKWFDFSINKPTPIRIHVWYLDLYKQV